MNAGFASTAQAAGELGIDRATLGRWERAEVVSDRMKLRALCEFYGLAAAERLELKELRRRAKAPRWWRDTGEWPDATVEFLGMEMAATRIRPDGPYATQHQHPTAAVKPPAQAPKSVTGYIPGFEGPLREAIVMVDELALTRMPGGPSVRDGQISRLLAPPEGVTVQVVPFSVGSASGTWFVCDFGA